MSLDVRDASESPIDRGATAYDRVHYPGHPFSSTHPDRLGTIGSLFGMDPAPAYDCRVLELGCGVGANLIPMAYQLPRSAFVGIDLSGSAIAKGRADIAALGLRNVDLRRHDIMDVDDAFGAFDYIIAHGVYSWVPAEVRRKILAIFRDRLAPQGIAYLSYNALPGSHLRDVGRSMMLFHTRHLENPRDKVRESRALLQFLAEASERDDLHGAVLRALLKQAGTVPDEVLYHDDLDPQATGFLFHEIVEDAARAGLQYLSEASLQDSTAAGTLTSLESLLGLLPEHGLVAREQCYDFVTGRWFRKTLLCRDEVALNRSIDPQSVRNYFIVANSAAAVWNETLAPGRPGAGESGSILAGAGPIGEAALRHLIGMFPDATDFPDLFSAALGQISTDADRSRTGCDEQADALAHALFCAYCANEIDLCRHPPPLTTRIDVRPQASLVARKQAETAACVTNLRHGDVELDDQLRRILLLVDGTRTVDAIAAEIDRDLTSAEPAESGSADSDESDARAQAERALRLLARLGLLVGERPG